MTALRAFLGPWRCALLHSNGSYSFKGDGDLPVISSAMCIDTILLGNARKLGQPQGQ